MKQLKNHAVPNWCGVNLSNCIQMKKKKLLKCKHQHLIHVKNCLQFFKNGWFFGVNFLRNLWGAADTNEWSLKVWRYIVVRLNVNIKISKKKNVRFSYETECVAFYLFVINILYTARINKTVILTYFVFLCHGTN